MTMHCVLVSLPLQDPSLPPLGLSLLSAALAHAGVEHQVIDANLDFLAYGERLAKVTPFYPARAKDGVEYLRLFREQQQMFKQMSTDTSPLVLSPWQVNTIPGWPHLDRVKDYALAYDSPWIAWLRQSDILERILAQNPRWVGLSLCFAGQLPAAMALGRMLRDKTAIPVIWGGGLLRDYARYITPQTPVWDCATGIILGTGEGLVTTMQQFGKGPRALRPTSAEPHTQGWIARAEEPQAALCPRFDALPLADYRSAGRVLPYRVFGNCGWGRCAFCADGKYSGHTHRLDGDAKAVAEELCRLEEQWQAKGIYFLDAELPASFMLELAQSLHDRQSALRWGGNARLDKRLATAEAAQSLHAGGCRFLRFGLESASAPLLRAMNKGITPAAAEKILRTVAAAGIGSHVYLIQGFPGETAAQLQATEQALLSLRHVVDSYSLSDFTLYEGSPLWQQLPSTAFLHEATPECWSSPRLVQQPRARLDAARLEDQFYADKNTRCFPTLADTLLLGERFCLRYEAAPCVASASPPAGAAVATAVTSVAKSPQTPHMPRAEVGSAPAAPIPPKPRISHQAVKAAPIRLRNVRVNNLRIDELTLEQGAFHVFCGPSGSGKSSLAFDVLYAAADRLGRATGVSRIYRKAGQGPEVENLPASVIGIEQQLTHRSMVESVAWHIHMVAGLRRALAPAQEGYCPTCQGRGYLRDIDPERVICHAEKPPTRGALSPAVKQSIGLDAARWKAYCKLRGIAETTPWVKLPAHMQHELLHRGQGGIRGILPTLREAQTGRLSTTLAEELDYYITYPHCAQCGGWGFVGASNAPPLTLAQTPGLGADAAAWISRLGIGQVPLLAPLFRLSSSIARKLRFFAALAHAQPHSLIIFDEPAAGLMPDESADMADILRQLQKQGHTVIAVEHAAQVIRAADYVVAFGPKAGSEGGLVVFQGRPKVWLQRMPSPPAPGSTPPPAEQKHALEARFTTWYGFTDFHIRLPLQRVVCICGPSGSGKSAYVEAAYAACDKTPIAWQGRTHLVMRAGQDRVRRPHRLTPDPIGVHAGSTPATYTGLWDKIRQLFATLPDAKQHRFNAAHFSFNMKQGQCPHCSGRGYLSRDTVRFEACPLCHGARYKASVLTVRHQGLNIAAVNELTVTLALRHFHSPSPITRQLEHFANIALAYLVLGQPSNTLSGGETLRVKLVELLSGRLGERSMYIMDNPCRGIGSEATALLVRQLLSLSHKHSVIVAENDPALAAHAHHLVLLGQPHVHIDGTQRLNVLYAGPPGRCPKHLWQACSV